VLRRLRIENLVLIREAELELAPGLNAITGETGAGKTILAQAIGLLLGARGEPALVAPGAGDAYVEAELEAPSELLEEDELASLRELRPAGEEGVVLARRISADGRSRAYAWGRAAAREDVAACAERLIAMSGQYEQRRLARPSYHLDLLDAYVGEEQLRRRGELRRAWRELAAARARHGELAENAAAAAQRLDELRRLVEDTEGIDPGREEELRLERERLRRAGELAEAAARAAEALAPEEGEGAAGLAALAERTLAEAGMLAPELAQAAGEAREAELRLREAARVLRRFLAAVDADPLRLAEVEEELARLADLRRRHRCATTEELLARAAEARGELTGLVGGGDPLAAAAAALAAAEEQVQALTAALRAARRRAAEPFAAAVAGELRRIGLPAAELRVELREREPSPSGADEAVLLLRANPGLPLLPVAQTASGGELSRIALAIAAVAGGATMVFDEIDAGIGGRTAHAVADALLRLAGRAQVITITHLPQIASRAQRHFRVEKVPGHPVHARIELLDGEERRREIERMLGGREFLAAVAGREGR
jgi:DNA repair protein RecN (Recombination protein N)